MAQDNEVSKLLPDLPKEIAGLLLSVPSKRAVLVIRHIAKYGSITTEDIRDMGYEHPPRAVRDVRESGIPLTMTWTQSSTGRRIGKYRFGDLSEIRRDRLAGRTTFPKVFKQKLYELYDGKCAICSIRYEERYFQIDHRIPYEVGGDPNRKSLDPDDYMILDGSCNRAKSWSCEHCENWNKTKDPGVCQRCYWASPEEYTHVAMQDIRRAEIVWKGKEVEVYEEIEYMAVEESRSVPSYVKEVLEKYVYGVEDEAI